MWKLYKNQVHIVLQGDTNAAMLCGSLTRILHADLVLHPYKLQIACQLNLTGQSKGFIKA